MIIITFQQVLKFLVTVKSIKYCFTLLLFQGC